MKSSTKPNAWTLSPQMTAAPNLWRNCVLMCSFWEGIGPVYDIANNVPLSRAGSSLPQWTPSTEGMSMVFGQAGDARVDLAESDHPSWGLSEISLVVRVYLDVEDIYGLFYGLNGEKGSIGNHLYIDFEGTEWNQSIPTLNAILSYTGSGGNTIRVSTTWSAPRFYTVGVSYSQATGQEIVYIDGMFSQNTRSGAMRSNTEGSSVGVTYNNSDSSVGNISLAAVWNRALTVNEFDRIDADPFAMLRPAGF